MSRLSLWRGEATIDQRRLRLAKVGLVVLILFTSVVPLAFVRPDDVTLTVNVYKYLAKTGALVGSMLLIWQFLLGFRGAVSAVVPDLTWVVDLHKKLGQFGVPVVLLHPVFIGLYYAEQRGINVVALDLSQSFSRFVLLGMVTLTLVAFVVLTSVLLRGRVGFYPWLYTHLSAYLIPPFLFVHSLLGPTTQETGLRFYWRFWAVVVAALLLYRLARKLGWGAVRYRVSSAREVAEATTEVVLAPEDRRLRVAPGQFVYLRHSLAENAHPYTVSGYDTERHLLSVTVKEEGSQTARLQGAQEGDRLLLDGPYGVFTRPARAKGLPLVMIAGGIGITPFRRLWQDLEREATREAHLIYGNEVFSEITYRQELDALEHVNVVHVLNDEPEFEGERGLITLEVLRRHLHEEVTEYQYLMCGPPPMVLKLEEELLGAGVPSDQVTHELFAT